MPNTLLSPPELDSHPVATPLQPAAEAPHVGTELKEEGVFTSLISSFRDVFFPVKLPPLELESKPIFVPDRMKFKRSPASTAVAIGLHVAVILLITLLVAKHVQLLKAPTTNLSSIDVPPPPRAPKADKIGGGGGQKGPTPVTQGHLPKLAQTQIVPPKAPPLIQPKLAVEPTVIVQPNLKMADSKMPDLGVPNSNLHGFSMGNGNGSGIGSGNGSGIGPGSGGNTGSGPMHVGGSVRAPSVLYSVEPEFSEEARKAKFSGNVQVYLWVDENGNPSHVKVVRGVGMGLDEKAVEAVRQYKFKPALQNGKPVKVDLYIDVNFQIF
ncbi:MAG: TonB family protein [Acidobacteriaceae bacterium]